MKTASLDLHPTTAADNVLRTDRRPCWDGKTQMAWIYDDGGRAGSGYVGRSGDCVSRAISIAAELPYQQVYDALNAEAKRERPRPGRRRSSSREGVRKTTYRRYLSELGWEWHPTMAVGRGCTVHLCEEELPMGRIIVKVSRHLTAVVDRVVHDTHDPQRADPGRRDDVAAIVRRCVYGYFTPPPAAAPAP